MTADRTLAEHTALVEGLRAVTAYPHAVDEVKLLETHISSVLLAGPYAYKLKKPLATGFLDFSTIAARRTSCEDEVRLNRRTAPDLYLDVVPITGSLEAPRVDGTGPAIEFALRMRRFSNDGLLDRLAREGRLGVDVIDALADTVADFHASLPPAPPDGSFGTPSRVHHWARENFAEMQRHPIRADLRARLATLAHWTDETFERRSHQFAARRHAGFVRECHGDLHLRNIVLIDGRPVPFNCIEFNAELRWIDVASEIAFTFMDLEDHGCRALAWRFVNRYVERTGDFAGLALLPFYAVYRALVRAKVALLRSAQPHVNAADRSAAEREVTRHVALAERLAAARTPVLVLMHGLSASGKSTVATRVAQAIEGIHVRSDVERKRLHGLAAAERSASGPDAGIYDRASSAATYARLADAARAILDAGCPAVVDATFARRSDRATLADVAHEEGAPAVIVKCTAPEAVLRERIVARAARGVDPSEATLDVLTRQIAARESVDSTEGFRALRIDTDCDAAELDRRIERLAAALAALGRGTGHHSSGT